MYARTAFLSIALVFASVPLHARALSLPEEIRVSVERCAGLAFDVEAYAQALEVELVVLGIAQPNDASAEEPERDVEGGRVVELSVTEPGCGDELSLTLRVTRQGETRQQVEQLRASDFEGVGRERALALATIERLRLSWSRLTEPPPLTKPKPAPAPNTAVPRSDRDQVDASEKKMRGGVDPAHSAFLGIGLGHLGATSWHIRAGAALELSDSFRITPHVELQNDLRVNTASLGTAHVLALGAIVSAQLIDMRGFALDLGPGARFALAWFDLDDADSLIRSTDMNAATSRETKPVAPLALVTVTMSARVTVVPPVAILLWLEGGYSLLGASYEAGGKRVIAWTGVSFSTGLAIAYMF